MQRNVSSFYTSSNVTWKFPLDAELWGCTQSNVKDVHRGVLAFEQLSLDKPSTELDVKEISKA